MNDDFKAWLPHYDDASLDAVDVRIYVQKSDAFLNQYDAFLQAFEVQYAQLVLRLLGWIQTHQLFEIHGFLFPPTQTPWSLDWMLCDDACIQAVNLECRQKDAPTDVLSFPSLENASLGDDHEEALVNFVPQACIPDALKHALTQQGGHMGTVMVSLDYARRHCGEASLFDYVLERLIHGTLHVLGVHHATQADYERVLSLQADFMQSFHSR